MATISRVEIYTSISAKADFPPLLNVLDGHYEQREGEVGSFELSLPLTDPNALNVTHGHFLRIFVENEGMCFVGIVDSIRRMQMKDRAVVRVSGPSSARQLVWDNSGVGLEYNNASLSSAVSTALSGTGWSSGSLATPSTNLESKRFDGYSKWAVLRKIADVFNLHLRADLINTEIDINSFGTNPNNVRLMNLSHVPADDSGLEVYPINGIEKLEESENLWTKAIVLGQREGLGGENTTIELSTRTSPYTPQSELDAGGVNNQWYLEDSAASTAYGTRAKTLFFKDVFPLGITDTDFERAANTLCDLGATWLERHKDIQEAYNVNVVGLPHLSGGSPLFQVGDKFEVFFQGYVVDRDGTGLTYLDIDKDLYVMGYRRTFRKDADSWRFQLTTIPRQFEDDGNRTAEFIEKVTALESAPLPFILFGDNVLRIDPTGIQLRSEGVNRVSIFGLDEFSSTPDTENRMRLAGQVDDGLGSVLGTFDVRRSGLDEFAANRLASSAGNNRAEMIAYYSDSQRAQLLAIANDTASVLHNHRGGHSGFGLWEAEKTPIGGAIDPQTLGIDSLYALQPGIIRVDTQSNAASDDLDTITASGSKIGQLLILVPENTARVVTVKHNTGNIQTANNADFDLDEAGKAIAFRYDGSDWREIFRTGGDAPLIYNTIDAGFESSNNDLLERLSLQDQFTLTNPGTTLTTIFDITGKGALFGVYIEKPLTTNSVGINIELTIDDTIVINDVTQTGTNTLPRQCFAGILGGDYGSSDEGPVGFAIPFNKNIKLRARFSGTPGGSENLTGGFSLAYE